MSTSELAVKKGDTVVVPGGAVRRVGYVGTGRRGGVRIGVIVPGQKELTFYSVGQLQSRSMELPLARVGGDPLVQLIQDGKRVLIRPAMPQSKNGGFGRIVGKAGADYDEDANAFVVPVPLTLKVAERLKQAGYEAVIHPDLRATLQARMAQARSMTEAAETRVQAVDQRLQERGLALFPFQQKGVLWLAPRSAALLGDEMGLGKTIQALAAAPEDSPVLVIVPKLAKGVWSREAAKWRPDLTTSTLAGRGSFRWPTPGELVITNYDVLSDSVPECPTGVTMVCDEAHVCKSERSLRGQRCQLLGRAVRARGGRVWLLTGTPLLNRPTEVWGILKVADLAEEAFGSLKRFRAFFGDDLDAAPTVEGADMLKRVMLRRRKRDVLTELPPKSYITIDVAIDEETRRICDEVVEKMKELGISIDRAVAVALKNSDDVAFELISFVRAAIATAKIPAMMDMVYLYEHYEEPLVIFSAHRAPIDFLAERPGWATVTGDTPPKERTAIEEAFQRGEILGIAATIAAGGTAITLTRGASVLFVDKAWTPALNEQAEDRCCRIGQVRGVQVTELVADHVLDQRVSAALSRKQQTIRDMIDAAATTDGE